MVLPIGAHSRAPVAPIEDPPTFAPPKSNGFFGENTEEEGRTKQLTQSVEHMNIYVANIAYSAKDQDLRELFEAFGEVTSAKIIMDKATNRSRGFGFVEMSDDSAGKAAIEGTNGKNFQGRDLVVNEARPRTEGGGDRGGFRSGGGGGFRDRGDRGGDRGGYRERSDRGDRGDYRRDEY